MTVYKTKGSLTGINTARDWKLLYHHYKPSPWNRIILGSGPALLTISFNINCDKQNKLQRLF